MRNIFLNGEGRVRGIWMMLAYAVISATFFRVLLPLAVFKLIAFDESKSIYQQPLLQCLFMWPALGFTILLGRACAKAQGHNWEYMGLQINKAWFRRLAMGFALGSAVGGATMAAYWALGLARFEWNPNAVYGSVIWGVYWCLMVGLFEESDYRGYFLRKGADSIGLWPAIFLQAVLFAAAHAANPGHSSRLVFALAMFNTFLYALVAGLAVVKTGSIGVAVGIHAAWNWMSGYAIGFALSGYERKPTLLFKVSAIPGKHDLLTGGAYGPEASVIWTGLIILGIAYFAWAGRARAALALASAPNEGADRAAMQAPGGTHD